MDEVPNQSERRPIPGRTLGISIWITNALVRCGVSANAISLAGMGFGVAAGFALGATSHLGGVEQRLAWVGGAIFIWLRLMANMFDGMVALASGKSSAVGQLYNEVPDRVSDSATLIGAGYAAGGDVVLGFAAACVALFTAYVRAIGKASGAPQIFSGPMAKQHRMLIVIAVALYCGLTPLAWQPRWDVSHLPGLMAGGLALIVAGSLVTAWRRLTLISAHLR